MNITEEFKDYEFVARAPCSFSYFGEHASCFGAYTLIQPIPLYVYVGLKEGKEIELEGVFARDWRSSSFYEVFVKEIFEEFKRFLISLINKDIINSIKGIKIKVLSEAPLFCGLNTSSAFSAAFSLALFYIQNKISVETPTQLGTIEGVQKKEEFDTLFRFAWMLDSLLHSHICSGAEVFCALIGSVDGGPILYFTEPRFGTVDEKAKIPHDLGYFLHDGVKIYDKTNLSHYSIYKKIKYKALQMDAFVHQRISDVADAYIIYSGSHLPTRDSIWRLRQKVRQYKRTDEFAKNLFKRMAPYPLSKKQDVAKKLMDAFSAFCVQGIRSYTSALLRQRIEEFFQYISDYNSLCVAYGFLDEYCAIEKKILSSYPVCALKCLSFGRSGDLLLLLKKGEDKSFLEQEDLLFHYTGLPTSCVEGASIWKKAEKKIERMRFDVERKCVIIDVGKKKEKIPPSISLLLLYALICTSLGKNIHPLEGFLLFRRWKKITSPYSAFSVYAARVNAIFKRMGIGKVFFRKDKRVFSLNLQYGGRLKELIDGVCEAYEFYQKEDYERAFLCIKNIENEPLFLKLFLPLQLLFLCAEKVQKKDMQFALLKDYRQALSFRIEGIKAMLNFAEGEWKIMLEEELSLLMKEKERIKEHFKEDEEEIISMIKKVREHKEDFSLLLSHPFMEKILLYATQKIKRSYPQLDEEIERWAPSFLFEIIMEEFDESRCKELHSLEVYLKKALSFRLLEAAKDEVSIGG